MFTKPQDKKTITTTQSEGSETWQAIKNLFTSVYNAFNSPAKPLPVPAQSTTQPAPAAAKDMYPSMHKLFPDLYPEQPPRASQPVYKQVEPCLDISALKANVASSRPMSATTPGVSGSQRERQLSSFIAQPTIAPGQSLQAKPTVIPKVMFQSCMLNQDIQLTDDSNTEADDSKKINISEIRKEQQVCFRYAMPNGELYINAKDTQYKDIKEQWDKLDELQCVEYCHRLRDWISVRMIRPLVEMMDKVNKELDANNYSHLNCYNCTLFTSTTSPSVPMPHSLYQLAQIYSNVPITNQRLDTEKYLLIPGFEQVEHRAYIIKRMKELGSGWRLAGFSIVKSEANQPTDRDIVLHIVKTYLSEMHTDVTPPLVDPPMDLMRFLVAYVWATPKLHYVFTGNHPDIDGSKKSA
ncbi:hypothetical protein INT43_003864 [Umbelopsis isabellina]|uniref:Uncharacterized protein n=1 Tax=Mortierella isabellina TaxID=91625 RepID=A0A8H7PTL4_MORIS|nr:hypothetical protein INT43_003864 [Umbelopsis isabellina]